ncbi:MAG: usg protein [Parvularculaceae bacterium]
MAVDPAFACQLQGYRLATAEILYCMPDHPGLLQSYVWQDYDLAPHYPVLCKFLDFWVRELDGRLHSVKLAGKRLVSPADIASGRVYSLH